MGSEVDRELELVELKDGGERVASFHESFARRAFRSCVGWNCSLAGCLFALHRIRPVEIRIMPLPDRLGKWTCLPHRADSRSHSKVSPRGE